MRDHVLVTGGAGAIGSNLVNRLASDPARRITVLDNLSSGRVENILPADNVRFIKGGVESDEDLDLAFESPPETVFHLAANFANQNSVDFPQRDLIANGVGTLKLLVRASRHGVRRFVYTSSSCVYGNRPEPLSEQCREFSLDTPYAITKLLGEDYCRFFHEQRGLPTVILRYFNVYGPNEYPGKYRNVVANFMYRAMRNEDLVITGTGEETRDFNYVDDTVRATLLAGESEAAVGRILNVASGREHRVGDVAELIRRLTGSASRIVHRERRSWDSVVRRVADVRMAKAVLGYEAQTDLKAGLAKYRDWLQSQDMGKCEW